MGSSGMLQGQLLAADSEVDFMVHGLYKLPFRFLGQEVYITTTHVSVAIVMLVILIFAIAANRRMRHAEEIPGGFQNVVELIVEMLDKMVYGSMGSYGRKYLNYIGTLFVFIFISNISGLFGLRAPTADYGVTLPLGVMTFLIIQFNNIKYNKFGAFTDLFKPIPVLFPINLIGELAVPFSLSLRLFGNVLSGTVMMSLIYSLLSKIAEKYNAGIPNVASKYILSQAGVAGAIIGIRNSRHVASNARIFEFDLDEEEIETIRAFLQQFPAPEGEPFELERTPGSKYRSIMHMNINEKEQS